MAVVSLKNVMRQTRWRILTFSHMRHMCDFQVLNNYETRENSEIVVYRLYQSSTASNLQITSF